MIAKDLIVVVNQVNNTILVQIEKDFNLQLQAEPGTLKKVAGEWSDLEEARQAAIEYSHDHPEYTLAIY